MAVGTLKEEGRGAQGQARAPQTVGAGFLICMSPRGLLLTESYLKPVLYTPRMSLSLTECPMNGGVFLILSLHSKAVLLRKQAMEPNLGALSSNHSAAYPVCPQATHLPVLPQFPTACGFCCCRLVHR